jgi:tRNA-specific 2-thiouridylase
MFEGHKGKKVFVGLSGGVDSAVSAALLQQEGYDVTGVFIRIALDGYPCSAGEDKVSAQRVAAHLKIPFIEIDLSKEYKDEVFKNTIEEFAKGRTPNPDTLCNQKIKFGHFFDFAMSRGADLVATGHYAQIKNGGLYAGVDANKDQSYFLWMVPQEHLAKTLFPIGHLHKPEVRALAQKFGLPNATRKDSQGLCFLGDLSIEDLLAREVPAQNGKVLDESGETIGAHRGAALYTLGQRHGFMLDAHTAHTQPHFVVAKDVAHNTLTVSTLKTPAHSTKTNIELTDCNWIGEVIDGTYTARYRYRQKLISTKLFIAGSRVVLEEPQYVPLGQSLVVYAGERCLGGGVVDKAVPE